MNRETQIWNNAKAIGADATASEQLKDIATRILTQQGVKATEADQVFEYGSPTPAVADRKTSAAPSKPIAAESKV